MCNVSGAHGFNVKSITAVFIWVSKSNWFCVHYATRLVKKTRAFFHPIRSKTKTNRDSLVRVFPHFASATCNYFVFWLVHLIMCPLWLARLISLVLVLRHSIENRSKKLSCTRSLVVAACCPQVLSFLKCDNPRCKFEWFHFQCVGLQEEELVVQWFCPCCTLAPWCIHVQESLAYLYYTYVLVCYRIWL